MMRTPPVRHDAYVGFREEERRLSIGMKKVSPAAGRGAAWPWSPLPIASAWHSQRISPVVAQRTDRQLDYALCGVSPPG